jgi:4-hydroxythreonine-4-phosphate dehydrogenase
MHLLKFIWKINFNFSVNHPFPHLVVTSGEPSGVGLDLCVHLAHQKFDGELTVISDRKILEERAQQMGIQLQIESFQAKTGKPHLGQGKLQVLNIECPNPVIPGKLNPNNSAYVLEMLDRATQGCLDGEFDAMVTCPVHKGVINESGIDFTGHTEYLADATKTKDVVMMLIGGGLRVALATTHLPLKHVSHAIQKESLEKTIRILHHDLIEKFGIDSPKIYITGLNPHAGESGHLGDEEIQTIIPVVESLKKEGLHLIGPLPADTMFSQENITKADAFLAMYHDQGLAVLKYASFGEGVNVTLGLPIIRTSVDHGTALNLAGTNQANPGSLFSAVTLALELVQKK